MLDYIGVHEMNNILAEIADNESNREDAPLDFIRQVTRMQNLLCKEGKLSNERLLMIANSLEEMSTYIPLSVSTYAKIVVISKYAKKVNKEQTLLRTK